MQLLPPDMLQDYIQQIINQTFATMGSVEDGGDESSSTVNTLQVSFWKWLCEYNMEPLFFVILIMIL